MTLTGTVEEIFPERKVSDKFTIKEFVLEVQDGNFTEHIKFQTSNKTMTLLDSVMVGERIEVHFNISGRKSKDTYWNTLKAWKIVADGSAVQNEVKPKEEPEWKANDSMPELPPSDVDDLPF